MRLSSYSTRHRLLRALAHKCAHERAQRWDGGRPASRNTSQCTPRRALGSCSSVLSHLLEQFSSSQQTTDGRRQRTGDLGTASKKKAKKTVPEQSVHSRLLEHTHQAAVIHAVAVVGVSQDFLHFPPASPAFCFIR